MTDLEWIIRINVETRRAVLKYMVEHGQADALQQREYSKLSEGLEEKDSCDQPA